MCRSTRGYESGAIYARELGHLKFLSNFYRVFYGIIDNKRLFLIKLIHRGTVRVNWSERLFFLISILHKLLTLAHLRHFFVARGSRRYMSSAARERGATQKVIQKE